MRKLLAVLIAALIALPALGIVKGDAPPEGDTRWDAVGSLDGYCSAVLVTPGAIITARHCVYGPTGVIAFRSGESVGVASFYFPEVGDAAIGYLASTASVEQSRCPSPERTSAPRYGWPAMAAANSEPARAGRRSRRPSPTSSSRPGTIRTARAAGLARAILAVPPSSDRARVG